MGNFLAVTAFKVDSVPHVSSAITNFMASHGVQCQLLPASSPADERQDVQLYAPLGGWTVALWPAYFSMHDFPLARALASADNWLLSTVHVYDDEYWEHLSCSGITELHAFCSRPHFWENESPEDFQRIVGFDKKTRTLGLRARYPACTPAAVHGRCRPVAGPSGQSSPGR